MNKLYILLYVMLCIIPIASALTQYPSDNPYGAEAVFLFDDSMDCEIAGCVSATNHGAAYSADTPFSSGKSAYCDNTESDYIDSNWYNFSSLKAFTISLWVKIDAPSDGDYIMGMWSNSGTNRGGLRWIYNTGALSTTFSIGDGEGSNDVAYFNNDSEWGGGGWSMITITSKGTNSPDDMKLYINNTLEVSQSGQTDEDISPDNLMNSEGLQFCALFTEGGAVTDHWQGYIDEIKKSKQKARQQLRQYNMALLNKFRKSKKNKNILVEKVRYAIDSLEEKEGISYEGIKARKRKALKSKLLGGKSSGWL